MRAALPATLLALLVVAAPALAHVESFSQAKTLSVGPYSAYLEPRPSPVYANQTFTASALFSDAQMGGTVRHLNASVVFGGPVNARAKLVDDGTGYHTAAVRLSEPGVYSLRLLVEKDGEVHAADADLEVFPDLPFRIRAADEGQDMETGVRTPLVFETVDPITLARADAGVQDLTLRVEHWTDDHVTMLGADEVPLEKAGPGLWRTDYVFDDVGMYHMRFRSESASFSYPDVPLLHVYATAPLTTDPPRESPAPGGAALLAAPLAAAALLLLARRRG